MNPSICENLFIGSITFFSMYFNTPRDGMRKNTKIESMNSIMFISISYIPKCRILATELIKSIFPPIR